MLHLTCESKILLAVEPVDFRKQIDGLVALCRHHFRQQPRDGSLYVFINRNRTMVKVLCYEGNGYWLSVKRLSRGRFTGWPTNKAGLTKVVAHELRCILRAAVAPDGQLV